MKLLLDTHILLWTLFSPKHLNEHERQVLKSPEHDVFVSSISLWEISLKYALGKLHLHNIHPDGLPHAIETSGFDILPLSALEASTIHRLPKLQGKDPSDRMLAWQAITYRLLLISHDKEMTSHVPHGLLLFEP